MKAAEAILLLLIFGAAVIVGVIYGARWAIDKWKTRKGDYRVLVEPYAGDWVEFFVSRTDQVTERSLRMGMAKPGEDDFYTLESYAEAVCDELNGQSKRLKK